MREFVAGASFVAAGAIALIFWRYWRSGSDRLYAAFAIGFGILSLHYVAMLVFPGEAEDRPALYVVRLVAFAVIIGGVLDKNRAAGRAPDR